MKRVYCLFGICVLFFTSGCTLLDKGKTPAKSVLAQPASVTVEQYADASSAFAARRYSHAALLFEELLVALPNEASIYYNLGLIYGEHLQRFDKSIDYYKGYCMFDTVSDEERMRIKELIFDLELRQKVLVDSPLLSEDEFFYLK